VQTCNPFSFSAVFCASAMFLYHAPSTAHA
jgi:hypothetical protein